MFIRRMRVQSTAIVCLCLLFNTAIHADEYNHYSNLDSFWENPSAWSPAAVPGEDDTANLYYGITLPESTAAVTSIGTLNIDTYISYGPPPDIDIRSGTLNIMDGGQWMWGGFNDYYYRTGTINQHGTFVLVDDIADHYGNGSAIVDSISHSIQWGLTFNNHGTMQHDSLGAFNLGASACQYVNYGTHDFTNDGSITTIGHGGERTTNYGLIKKSGGVGTSSIHSEFINNGTVEVQTGRITIGNSLQYESWATHELQGGTWVVQDNADLVIGGRGVLETNQGSIVLNGSNANFYTTQTSTYTPIDASLLVNGGTLEIHGDRTFSHAITNTGTLKIGDVTTLTADITNSGQMHIGNSPGHSIIDGNFEQSADGELLMEIAGLTAGEEFDVLEVLGTATLDGILNLSTIDFTATVGDEFRIIDAEAVIGEFSTVIFPDAQNWYIDYDDIAGDVTVGVAVPEPATLFLMVCGLLSVKRSRR